MKAALRYMIIASLAFSFTLVAGGHSGGTDANGGHHDRKNGGYHYHSGPKSGSSKSSSQKSSSTKKKTTEKSYWLNTNSGVRHNSRCRYYKNTKSGRAATKAEGRACGTCGG